ncbi:sulfite exporter TauE/SafE family protein [Kineosporia sp. J2-2]|uniref:Probable membrane transporter protein n=1 Tax=Kineosporia corallincola TaxID=2835133 RepID=A0ABS5THI8_9ACTN|nr:sulfite exporter TauE/SafE family protein [Kineosporia corallincola]MBT0770537.1 sulfite exporter TauE/SafE family protein [Kineosporia corallincola]
MDFDPWMALAAFGIGIVVGLTGMGGGALMTPVLVLFFGVAPTAAVSSDLVAAAVMKPVGSFVHLRRGTVNLSLVRWLCVGSVPAAFCGVLITRALGSDESVQHGIKIALGVALLIAAGGLGVRAYQRLVERAARRDGRAPALPTERPEVVARPLPTIAIGALGGLIVGITSVGSGSLIIIALMALYPTLKANQLVGTDLFQAVPLVFSAALGHILFGDFQLDLTLALIVGSVPGAWLGAQLSTRLPGGLVRRALAFVLLASALKMFGVGNTGTAALLAAFLVITPAVWMLLRRRHGFPALARPGEDDEEAAAADPGSGRPQQVSAS